MSRRDRRAARRRLTVSPRVRIRKSSGLVEPFSPAKLQTSLIRCGAPRSEAKQITASVRSYQRPEITTELIRKFVLKHLKDAYPAAATRYQLSRSIIKLGPTGFPFEKLVAKLYESEGYQVQINQTRSGVSVNHEIDVIATKAGVRTFVECKFHVTSWAVCDLKTALYIKARSDDLLRSKHPSSRHDRFVLMTNTRFSSEAITFASTAGIDLVGWTYPDSASLSHRLEVSGLIPLTALTTLPRRLSEIMMESGVVTVRDLVESPDSWKMLGSNPKLLERVQVEIDALFEAV